MGRDLEAENAMQFRPFVVYLVQSWEDEVGSSWRQYLLIYEAAFEIGLRGFDLEAAAI